MITLSHLYKSYASPNQAEIPALIDLDLKVAAGEIFGVIGESGAGKSTLIRCVNLLEAPNSGQVIVDGQDLTQLDPMQLRSIRRKIGMIFQHFNLLQSRTVYENISLPLELAGERPAAIAKKITPLLELTGLADRRDHYPSQLSGGQKQRVAIARALANDPKVLLSDEATSALDPETKHSILQLLKEINTRLGLTILLITHEMGVIKEICHRLAILEKGKIAEESAVLDFFGRPKTEIAKKFIRSMTIYDLPEPLQRRFTPESTTHALPLWRLSFIGRSAEEPLISHLVRSFNLNINILQAQIEQIRDETVGVMILEVTGDKDKIAQGSEYLISKNVYVEVIGYVLPAYE